MPLFGCAHHGAIGVIDDDLRRRIAMDAHFVLDTAAINAIALTQSAICIDHEFRHDKQTHAFDARRRIRQASQHQVDDVVW